MAKCVEHPQNDSIGKCSDCGKEICSVCLTATTDKIKASKNVVLATMTALADKLYCPSCIDKLIQKAIEKQTVVSEEATKSKIIEDELKAIEAALYLERQRRPKYDFWALFLTAAVIGTIMLPDTQGRVVMGIFLSIILLVFATYLKKKKQRREAIGIFLGIGVIILGEVLRLCL